MSIVFAPTSAELGIDQFELKFYNICYLEFGDTLPTKGRNIREYLTNNQ